MVKVDEGKSNEVDRSETGEHPHRRARASLDLATSPLSSTDTLDRLLENTEKKDVEREDEGTFVETTVR